MTMQAPTETNNGAAPTQATALALPEADMLAGANQARAISAFSGEAAFVAAQRMAKALSSSSLMPKDYQSNIPNCLIAMELANRIGASVLMVAQSLDVIHGRPSWRAQFLIATVNSCGRFTPLRYKFEGKPGTDGWGCRAYAQDRASGDKEPLVGPLITIGLAKSEGWFQKNGSKWQTMPELMLHYRSAAFWTRIYAPELALGMTTSEEIVDTTGYVLPDTPAALTPGSTQALEAALTASATPPQVVESQAEPTPAAEPKARNRKAPSEEKHDPVTGELPLEREPGSEG